MTTINLHTFNGSNFHDLYITIMKQPAISFKLLIPRFENDSQLDTHFINSMEFACAAYAFQLLRKISTDFSYTVPSAYKRKPFECFLETTEPQKLTDLVYRLLCVYHPLFSMTADEHFQFEAAQYFTEAINIVCPDVAAYGLIAVAKQEFEQCVRNKKWEDTGYLFEVFKV